MDNLDAAVQDFSAVLALDSHNTMAQQQLAVARQCLAQYIERQRLVYAGMFTKFAAFDSSVSEYCYQKLHVSSNFLSYKNCDKLSGICSTNKI